MDEVATPSSAATEANSVAYVGIGANLGLPRATIASAIRELAALESTRDLRSSSLYRSASMGAPGPDYLNAAIAIRTTLSARSLLAELQNIETVHGRERSFPNAPRTLDLDLLLHGDVELNTPELVLPHPRLHERAFVLVPLAEIAPGLVIPGAGRVADLLQGVAGQRIDRL